jgi:hypothetical protein
MFSLHIYLPSQLPPLCDVGIDVTLIYWSILVIFNFFLTFVLFLLLHYQLSAWNSCEQENDSFHLTHLVVYNLSESSESVLPVACPNTKSVFEGDLTNLWLVLMQDRVTK